MGAAKRALKTRTTVNEKEYLDLKEHLSKVEADNERLIADRIHMRESNEQLIAECRRLREANKKLTADCKRLRGSNSAAEQTGFLRQVNASLSKQCAEQQARIDELEIAVKERDSKIDVLEKENTKLRNALAHAQSILNNNSDNTGLPPSTDKHKKSRKAANEYNDRDEKKQSEKTKRKAGGQKGHAGKTLTKERVQELIDSGRCIVETHVTGEPGNGPAKKRYTLDTITKVVVHEHVYWPDSDGKYAMPPEFVRSEVVYGPEIKAKVACLYAEGVLSISRISTFLEMETCGDIRMSEGTVWNILQEIAKKSGAAVAEITRNLLGRRVMPTDATVMNLRGQDVYIRCFCSPKEVLYVPMERKNLDTLENIPLLAAFQGILVHDHETAMYHFGRWHAECNVHLLRYLRKCLQESQNSWCTRLRDLLLLAKKGTEANGGALSAEDAKWVEDHYDEIIKLAEKQNKESKEAECIVKSELALIKRLKKYKDPHLLFIHDPDVPFSNNDSENALRPCKTRDKISGAFRSNQGLETYSIILTLMESAKRHGIKAYEVFRNVLTVPEYTLEMPEEPAATAVTPKAA